VVSGGKHDLHIKFLKEKVKGISNDLVFKIFVKPGFEN
jgi:hypothetical protein